MVQPIRHAEHERTPPPPSHFRQDLRPSSAPPLLSSLEPPAPPAGAARSSPRLSEPRPGRLRRLGKPPAHLFPLADAAVGADGERATASLGPESGAFAPPFNLTKEMRRFCVVAIRGTQQGRENEEAKIGGGGGGAQAKKERRWESGGGEGGGLSLCGLCGVVKKTWNLPPTITHPSTYKHRGEAPRISFGQSEIDWVPYHLPSARSET